MQLKGDRQGRRAGSGADRPRRALLAVLAMLPIWCAAPAAAVGADDVGDLPVSPTTGSQTDWTFDTSSTQPAQTLVVDSDLVVGSGATVRFEGTTLLFTDGHGVLVEPGGRMELADGAGHGVRIGPQAPGGAFSFRVAGELIAEAGMGHTIEGVTTGAEGVGAIVLAPGAAVATLEDLTLRGNADAGLLIGPGATVSLTDVRVEGVPGPALRLAGGTHVTLDRFVSTDGPVAVEARVARDLTIRSSTLRGTMAAVRLLDQAHATIEGSSLGGRLGLALDGGSEAEIESSSFEAYTEGGVLALSGAHLTVTHSTFDGAGAALFGVLANQAALVDLIDVDVRGHAAGTIGAGDGVRAVRVDRLDVDGLRAGGNAGWGVRIDSAPHTLQGLSSTAPNGLGLAVVRWTLTVEVVDTAGQPLAGATVDVVDADGLPVRAGTTGEDGSAGPWSLEASRTTDAGATTTLAYSARTSLSARDVTLIEDATVRLGGDATQAFAAGADATSTGTGTSGGTGKGSGDAGGADAGADADTAGADGASMDGLGQRDRAGLAAGSAAEAASAGTIDPGTADEDATEATSDQGVPVTDATPVPGLVWLGAVLGLVALSRHRRR